MMTARREFPARIKVAAFERAKGRCDGCTAQLAVGKFDYDHVLPDALGGEPTLENCEVLCAACHGAKTASEDVPRIAKANRSRKRHIGAHRPRSVLPGSKASPFKKRLDGTVERRDV